MHKGAQMSSRVGGRLTVAVLAAGLLVFAGCGDEATPTVEINDCGSSSALSLDGEDVSVGEACGECDRGTVVCDGTAEGGLRCDDPDPTNGCGGCNELDGEPGAQCVRGDGEVGLWECQNDSVVNCRVTFSNACGGAEPLDDQPGEACGECGLGEFVCDGGDAVMCSDDQGCPDITSVDATEGTRSDGVRVTWYGSVWASGYRVYRDGDEIAELSAGTLSYLDTEAEAAGAPDEVVVTASTDRSDGIEVTWHAEAGDAPSYQYQVEIIYPEGASDISDEVTGYRGSSVAGYELSIDGGTYEDMGTETTLFVDDADMASVTSLGIAVVDSSWQSVTLEAQEPQIMEASTYDFSVRAISGDGQQSDAGQATGQRAYGPVSYEWTAAVDSEIEPLSDCIDMLTCVDDDFSGDVIAKDYSFSVTGPGLEPSVLEIEGSLVLLQPEAGAVDVSYEVGETVTLMAHIVDDAGDPVERPGVELEFDIDDPSVIDETLPQTVTTDANGQAQITVTFANAAEEVEMMVTSTGNDPRVASATSLFGVFEVVAPAEGD